MRKFTIILVICTLIALPAVGFSAPEQRVALVIGNSAYRNAPLINPANDATDISHALKRLGFKVTVLRDASQRAMEDSIRKFGKRLSKGGVGLFYYADHGMQVDGRNYLIPVDARIESPSDVKYEALDAGRVLGKMEDAGNDMNIVILDACRDNPFSRSWRSGQKGLARMDAPKGSYIAYATAPGSVAADGSGRNGTYTNALLRHIDVPGLTLESMMKRVRKDVIDETGSKQVPWASTSLIGDFYFNSKRGIAVEKRLPIKQQKPVKETQKLASISPDISKQIIVNHDRHFIKYKNGVVYDTKTGLEWMVGPTDLTWDQARDWVRDLNMADPGWRMPRLDELRTLYEKGIGPRNMTPLLNTSVWRIWSGKIGVPGSGTINYSYAFIYYFEDDRGPDFMKRDHSEYNLALAVRKRK